MQNIKDLLRFYLKHPVRLFILIFFLPVFSLLFYFLLIQFVYRKPFYDLFQHLGLLGFMHVLIILLLFLIPVYTLARKPLPFLHLEKEKKKPYFDALIFYTVLYNLFHFFRSIFCQGDCYAYDDLRTTSSFFFVFLLLTVLFLKRTLINDEKGLHFIYADIYERLKGKLKHLFDALSEKIASWKKASEIAFDPMRKPVHLMQGRKDFEYSIFYEDFAPGTVIIVDREKTSRDQERIVGAAVHTNAAELRKNRDLVKKHRVERSESSRRSADVPGYQFLADRFNRYVDGKKVFLWHRTHLIPFRHTLSEGDNIPNLMFAGTAHLNSGARPDIGYLVQPGDEYWDSRDSRKAQLYQNFRLYQPLRPQKEARKVYREGESVYKRYYAHIHEDKDITVPDAPEGTYYCLDDVEQTVDMIIRDYPRGDFVYATLLEYQNENDLAPKWVTAMLIEKKAQALVFKIKLLNDL